MVVQAVSAVTAVKPSRLARARQTRSPNDSPARFVSAIRAPVDHVYRQFGDDGDGFRYGHAVTHKDGHDFAEIDRADERVSHHQRRNGVRTRFLKEVGQNGGSIQHRCHGLALRVGRRFFAPVGNETIDHAVRVRKRTTDTLLQIGQYRLHGPNVEIAAFNPQHNQPAIFQAKLFPLFGWYAQPPVRSDFDNAGLVSHCEYTTEFFRWHIAKLGT
jgi:hypothetical protein